MDSLDCEAIRNLSLPEDFGKDVAHLKVEEQQLILQWKKMECICQMRSKPVTLTGDYCSRTWDNVMCWDDTPAGSTVYKTCPSYINNFKTHNLASKTCHENGTWFSLQKNSSSNKSWTNYTACPNNDLHLSSDSYDLPRIFARHFDSIRVMCDIGYGISLVSLLLACTIMICFRKLHCPRNTIHLNLFASFILRAAVSLIRDSFMIGGLGFPDDVSFNHSGGIIVFNEGMHLECRLFFSVFYYAIAASYSWIFMEAVYLHLLIFVSVLTDKIKICWFMLFGWSIPSLIIAGLCIVRYYLDNTLCWNTFNIQGLLWIFKGPIMLTTVINFVLFINIIRVLYTKLKAPQCPDSKRTRFRKLARGTFFLVPTFGVHFIIFTIPLDDLGGTVEFVMLSIEMFFNSFQGVLIAFILCFFNQEVREEIKRSWRLRPLFMNRRERSRRSRNPSYRSSRYSSIRKESLRMDTSLVDGLSYGNVEGDEITALENGRNDGELNGRNHKRKYFNEEVEGEDVLMTP